MSDSQGQHNLFRILQQKISIVHSQNSIQKRKKLVKQKFNRYKYFTQHQKMRVMLHEFRVIQVKQEYKRTVQHENDTKPTVIIQKLEQSPIGCNDEEKHQKDFNDKIKVLEEQISDCEQSFGPIRYKSDIKQMEDQPQPKIQDPIIQTPHEIFQEVLPQTQDTNLKVLIEEEDENMEIITTSDSQKNGLELKESLQQIKQNDQIEQEQQSSQIQEQLLEEDILSNQLLEIQQLIQYQSQSIENIQDVSQIKELQLDQELEILQEYQMGDLNEYQKILEHQANQEDLEDQEHQVLSESLEKQLMIEQEYKEFEEKISQSNNNLQCSMGNIVLQEEEESTISKNVFLDCLDRNQQELQQVSDNFFEQQLHDLSISSQLFNRTQKFQLEISNNSEIEPKECLHNSLNDEEDKIIVSHQIHQCAQSRKKLRKVKKIPKKLKLLRIFNKIYKKQQNQLTQYFQTLVSRVTKPK